jgi:hypothetical protein
MGPEHNAPILHQLKPVHRNAEAPVMAGRLLPGDDHHPVGDEEQGEIVDQYPYHVVAQRAGPAIELQGRKDRRPAAPDDLRPVEIIGNLDRTDG